MHWEHCPDRIWSDCPVEGVDYEPDEDEEVPEEEAEWRGDAATWTIPDFFEVLKQQYRDLKWIPIGPKNNIIATHHPSLHLPLLIKRPMLNPITPFPPHLILGIAVLIPELHGDLIPFARAIHTEQFLPQPIFARLILPILADAWMIVNAGSNSRRMHRTSVQRQRWAAKNAGAIVRTRAAQSAM